MAGTPQSMGHSTDPTPLSLTPHGLSQKGAQEQRPPQMALDTKMWGMGFEVLRVWSSTWTPKAYKPIPLPSPPASLPGSGLQT